MSVRQACPRREVPWSKVKEAATWGLWLRDRGIARKDTFLLSQRVSPTRVRPDAVTSGLRKPQSRQARRGKTRQDEARRGKTRQDEHET
ncbi:hypothetical protein Ct61P_02409 [Colletotrichum tofieldiae]|nr:hypothetical protein Ct61P_02409 [Colletotrichum tofieldiae]